MLLAQITDLHIKPRGRLAYRTVDTAQCLEKAVEALLAVPQAPDAVLVTGDLVDAGRPEEYGLLKEILSPIRLPLFLMPGNHDARGPLRAVFADHRYLGSDGPIQYTVEEFPLRLIALDSLVDGQGGGQLGAAQLDWLDRRLAEQPERPTVVAAHHPPFATGIGHMDKIGLEDAAGLAEVIRKHGQVERVLSGHLHRSIQTRFAGTLASTAPSTAHAVALNISPDAPSAFSLEPSGFQLHWYEPTAGLISHTAAIGDFPGPFPFFENGVLID
ncbi:3',5'-cyclic adenosine monophosphate phosphodiesterase CpdA [Aliidongia dinghuensis]|uniref:3',5'-cyclic adenosine monophosphate phosphodiesterase CpdA n=1 Tax=Aliidongia dinghuensis TaxID=1867774 RepID=A0A8J3E3V6_9PROT|nr:phosphodiesterase [Aliidongia dinghuensis]GGF19118.1 3',5'-cyclic adenosine monophosphate phosphodiesterase CpdA [Aliidongia dinghuensis]